MFHTSLVTPIAFIPLNPPPPRGECALISQRVIERFNCNCHHNLWGFFPLYDFVTPRLQLCVPPPRSAVYNGPVRVASETVKVRDDSDKTQSAEDYISAEGSEFYEYLVAMVPPDGI